MAGKMAAPLKVGFPRISNKNFKILKRFPPNLQCHHTVEVSFVRLYRHKAFRRQIYEKQRNFTKFITPILVGCSGLSLYEFFRWFSGDVSGPQLYQKIQAKTSDISGVKNNNFIADAVDIAAPAVVFLQVKRYSRLGYEESKGSGFIVRSDGLILTNAHVVREGGEIIVKMKNGKEYIGTVHAVDQVSDLATIKINEKNLPVIKLGDSSNLRAGEWVVALGCPLSLKFTVTVGIVSSKHRAGQEMGFRNRDDIGYIQTDAAITIGNSGGPLINLEGEAIGINTWTVKDGISFAIPSDYAKKFVERAESYSKAASQRGSWFGSSQKQKHYYLGLTMMTLNHKVIDALRDQIASFPPDCNYGVFVHGVKLPSPAYRGGLQVGDIIVAINDKPVQTVNEVYEAVSTGKELTLTVKRFTQTLKLHCTPEEVR